MDAVHNCGRELVSGTATFADQAILFQRSQHHAKLARRDGRHGAPDRVDGHRVAPRRTPKALDQRQEVVVRRIPSGHEESLQPPVASLEQQDAVGGLAVAAGSTRLLVVDIE